MRDLKPCRGKRIAMSLMLAWVKEALSKNKRRQLVDLLCTEQVSA